MYLYAFLIAQFPELFSCVGNVRNYNGNVLFVVGWWIVVAVAVGGGGGLDGVGDFVLATLVEGPVWKLTMF